MRLAALVLLNLHLEVLDLLFVLRPSLLQLFDVVQILLLPYLAAELLPDAEAFVSELLVQ